MPRFSSARTVSLLHGSDVFAGDVVLRRQSLITFSDQGLMMMHNPHAFAASLRWVQSPPGSLVNESHRAFHH